MSALSIHTDKLGGTQGDGRMVGESPDGKYNQVIKDNGKRRKKEHHEGAC